MISADHHQPTPNSNRNNPNQPQSQSSITTSPSPSSSPSLNNHQSPTTYRRPRSRTGNSVLDHLAGSFARLLTPHQSIQPQSIILINKTNDQSLPNNHQLNQCQAMATNLLYPNNHPTLNNSSPLTRSRSDTDSSSTTTQSQITLSSNHSSRPTTADDSSPKSSSSSSSGQDQRAKVLPLGKRLFTPSNTTTASQHPDKSSVITDPMENDNTNCHINASFIPSSVLSQHQPMYTPSSPLIFQTTLSPEPDRENYQTIRKPILHLDPTPQQPSQKHQSTSNGELTPTRMINSPTDSVKTQRCSPVEKLIPNNESTFRLKSHRRRSVLNASCTRDTPAASPSQRWSLEYSITPKDLIAMECPTPLSYLNQNSTLTAKPDRPKSSTLALSPNSPLKVFGDHRCSISGTGSQNNCGSNHSNSMNFKRVSWNDSGSPSLSRSWFRRSTSSNLLQLSANLKDSTSSLLPPRLSKEEIESIEKLNVNFVDHQNPSISSPSLFRSSSNGSSSTSRSCRRASVINTKRRKSLKLLHLPQIRSSPGPLAVFPKDLTPSLTSGPESCNTAQPLAIDGKHLIELVENHRGMSAPLLVIDLRSLDAYLGPTGRLQGSINVNFPTLIIKRFRKGNQGNLQLNSFITTEAGKRYYAKLEKSYKADDSSSVLADLDICVIDDDLVEQSLANRSSENDGTGKVLLDVLSRLFMEKNRKTGLYYLSERFEEFATAFQASEWLVSCKQPETSKSTLAQQGSGTIEHSQTPSDAKIIRNSDSQSAALPQGLLRLRPSNPPRSLPSIEKDATPQMSPVSEGAKPSCSNIPDPCTVHVPNLGDDASEPRNQQTRVKPPKLRRIDTSDSLLATPRTGKGLDPKFSLAQIKTDALSLASSSSRPSLLASARHSFRSAQVLTAARPEFGDSATCGSNTQKSVPFSPMDRSGMIQEPSNLNKSLKDSFVAPSSISPAPTTHPEIAFGVSTIIPSFLYLGSEPSRETDFAQLKSLGVKRILNLALECSDEEQLIKDLYPFIEKYVQIPLRDFVEEVGVQKRIDEANMLLDDASLHSAPTYVHCKAGKSRSVTIVLAYLIHRYRWSLRQSYAHVSERRKGICPNIGFLAELMNFEERELGSKSHGVVGPSSAVRSFSHHFHPSTFSSFSSPVQATHRITDPRKNLRAGSMFIPSEPRGFEKSVDDKKGSKGSSNEDEGLEEEQDQECNGNNGRPYYQRHGGIRVRSVGIVKNDFRFGSSSIRSSDDVGS